MKSICGANCDDCEYGKNCGCQSCQATSGCPFGKECFIYKYIKVHGVNGYNALQKQIIAEFNALGIEGMPEITKLFALNGKFVNLAYPIPNGAKIPFLDDNEIYLGTQVERLKTDGNSKCFGLVAGKDFLLVSEYGENGSDPCLVLFKKRGAIV